MKDFLGLELFEHNAAKNHVQNSKLNEFYLVLSDEDKKRQKEPLGTLI